MPFTAGDGGWYNGKSEETAGTPGKGAHRVKRFLHRILYPHPAVYVVAILSGFGGLILTFPFGIFLGPLTGGIYAVSFYALVISVLGIIRFFRWAGRHIGETAFGRFLKKAFGPESLARLDLWLGVLLNVGMASLKLWIGVTYASRWYLSVGVYYLALTGIWLFLTLRDHRVRRHAVDPYRAGWGSYLATGIMLLFLDAALTTMATLMVLENDCAHYPGYFIYAVALYAFYRMYVSIRRLFDKRITSPVLRALKGPNLSKSLVSVFSLQAALLSQFGADMADGERRLFNAVTGLAVTVAIIAIAVTMVVRGIKMLRRRTGNLLPGDSLPDDGDDVLPPE